MPALCARARRVVEIPVESFGQNEALRSREAKRGNVGRENQKAGEFLPAFYDSEFGALLDRVDGVTAGIGEANDLGLGSLRLQQERREVVGVDRMTDLAQHLAAVLEHDGLGIALQRMTESIVGGEEEPGI